MFQASVKEKYASEKREREGEGRRTQKTAALGYLLDSSLTRSKGKGHSCSTRTIATSHRPLSSLICHPNKRYQSHRPRNMGPRWPERIGPRQNERVVSYE